ncbi:MAG: TonB-dependent receptor plug domain-containing protein, partial [Prevotellaceae bacterium]|nr:TonB-dependent receptor plug domain-containing protein [Prevotellaceae bacterium]
MKDCKSGGRSKLLTMVVVGALMFANGDAMANPAVSGASSTAQQQQSVTVKGTVTDVNGEPIIGASVMEKGTAANGTVTNVDGQFTLTVKQGATLDVSYIGYTKREVKAQTGNMAITLTEDARMLDEVEIVAEFGTKRVARSIGSSVQNVRGQDITDSGRENFISALQGRVAGMNVVSSGGAPGASTTVTLRSATSISGNNQPLYVVDGIPIDNSSFDPSQGFANIDQYASRGLDFSSRGNDINPDNIESLTILKGAAAAALYGSNASNGAI